MPIIPGTPGLDVISLAEAKLALNIPGANVTQDGELSSYISAISLRLDRLVGPIVRRTITDEVHDGGQYLLTTRYYPVDSIVSIVERQGTTAVTLAAENFAAPTANDYLLDLTTGIIRRCSGGSDYRFYAGRANVLVTYVAGRFADTASVDPRFKQAAAIMLTHLWRKEQGANPGPYQTSDAATMVPGWAVPRAVLGLLEDQLLAPTVG